jgi:hypothetical protein
LFLSAVCVTLAELESALKSTVFDSLEIKTSVSLFSAETIAFTVSSETLFPLKTSASFDSSDLISFDSSVFFESLKSVSFDSSVSFESLESVSFDSSELVSFDSSMISLSLEISIIEVPSVSSSESSGTSTSLITVSLLRFITAEPPLERVCFLVVSSVSFSEVVVSEEVSSVKVSVTVVGTILLLSCEPLFEDFEVVVSLLLSEVVVSV